MKQQLRDRLLKQLNDKDDAPLAHCAKFDDDKLVSIITNFIAAFPAFSARLYDLHGHLKRENLKLERISGGLTRLSYIFKD
jgi:hypothetical protein